MGGVAVLHPQDVLNLNRMPLLSPPPSKSRGRIPNSNSNPRSVSNRRKRSPQKKTSDVSRSPPPKTSNPPKGGGVNLNGSNLVMGKVKILKRGEDLGNDGKAEKKSVLREDESVKQSKDLESIEMLLSRLGPEPEMVPKQIRLAADFYAGSAFDASPPPSSLPVPEFFFKKRAPEVDLVQKNDDSSTDLCRLLKLAGIEISA